MDIHEDENGQEKPKIRDLREKINNSLKMKYSKIKKPKVPRIQKIKIERNQLTFNGTITNLFNHFGFIDEDIYFSRECVVGHPHVGDMVEVCVEDEGELPFQLVASSVKILSQQGSEQTKVEERLNSKSNNLKVDKVNTENKNNNTITIDRNMNILSNSPLKRTSSSDVYPDLVKKKKLSERFQTESRFVWTKTSELTKLNNYLNKISLINENNFMKQSHVEEDDYDDDDDDDEFDDDDDETEVKNEFTMNWIQNQRRLPKIKNYNTNRKIWKKRAQNNLKSVSHKKQIKKRKKIPQSKKQIKPLIFEKKKTDLEKPTDEEVNDIPQWEIVNFEGYMAKVKELIEKNRLKDEEMKKKMENHLLLCEHSGPKTPFNGYHVMLKKCNNETFTIDEAESINGKLSDLICDAMLLQNEGVDKESDIELSFGETGLAFGEAVYKIVCDGRETYDWLMEKMVEFCLTVKNIISTISMTVVKCWPDLPNLSRFTVFTFIRLDKECLAKFSKDKVVAIFKGLNSHKFSMFNFDNWSMKSFLEANGGVHLALEVDKMDACNLRKYKLKFGLIDVKFKSKGIKYCRKKLKN